MYAGRPQTKHSYSEIFDHVNYKHGCMTEAGVVRYVHVGHQSALFISFLTCSVNAACGRCSLGLINPQTCSSGA